MDSHNLLFRSFFTSPNLPLSEALGSAVAMLKLLNLEPDHYTINPGHGSRRNERPLERIYSSDEIIEEVRRDTFNEGIAGPGFIVRAIRGKFEQGINVSPPHPRSPFQSFGISSTPSLGVLHFHELIKKISRLGELSFAGAVEGSYMVWQRCNEVEVYEKNYGPNPGFTVTRLELSPPAPTLMKLDISKNPGRISSVKKLPVFVAADMWLGPAFWKYAPCTKEEVLKEPWVEVEDTERYLYLKAYPEPFTRPDGEQGRIQRRIWNVLFHQDCEWPPGSGTIAEA